MNLRDLKYLVALAEHEHFSRAAEACFISQPTLSTQIKKLEEELGITLVERHNKQILLTAIGQDIVARARKILQQADELKQAARQAADPASGYLSLGLIPTLGPYLLPHIMHGLTAQFPKLKFLLHEKKTADILEDLKNGKLDAAILALPVESELAILPLFQEPFLLALPKQHRLCKKPRLDINDLGDENIILLEEGHCLRDQALSLCHANHVNEIPGFRATSLETLRQMVATGIGITLIPALAILTERYHNPQIVAKPLDDAQAYREIALVHRKTSPHKTLLCDIAMLITQEIKPLLAH